MIITLRGVLKSELYKYLKYWILKVRICTYISKNEFDMKIDYYRFGHHTNRMRFLKTYDKLKTKLTWKLVFRKYSTTTDNYKTQLGSRHRLIRWFNLPWPRRRSLTRRCCFLFLSFSFRFPATLRCSFRLVCVKPEACFC